MKTGRECAYQKKHNMTLKTETRAGGGKRKEKRKKNVKSRNKKRVEQDLISTTDWWGSAFIGKAQKNLRDRARTI